MRGWIAGAVIAGALVLLLWRVTGATPSTPVSEQPSAPGLVSNSPLPRTSPPAPAHAHGLSIRGTVVDAWGKGVAGARVSASWPEAGRTLSEIPCSDEAVNPWEAVQGETPTRRKLLRCLPRTEDLVLSMLLAREGEADIFAEAVSGEDGAFVLQGLPQGPQVLLALSEHGTAMQLGIPAGTDDVSLVLEQPHYMKGRAIGDGAPLAGASVMVVGVDHTRFFDASTDEDGRFHVGPLPRGGYQVLVSKEGWRPALEEVPLDVEDAEVRLQRRQALSGRVVANGVPVPAVEVEVIREGSNGLTPQVFAKSDGQGRFSLEVGTGKYTLTAERGGQYALTRVELPLSSTAEVVLKLGEALHVEGMVLNDARGAVAGAKVMLERPGRSGKELSVVTDANGRYRAGPVDPGSWNFVVEAEGHLDVLMEERTLAADMKPQDFTLKRAASIVGRIVDRAGRPVPGVHVALEKNTPEEPVEYEPQEGAYSDRDGRFVLDASAPGEFRVHIREDDFLHTSIAVKAPVADVVITLSEGASVEGTLTDTRGLPLPGFHVSVIPRAEAGHGHEEAPSREGTTTDAQGRFHCKGLTPGRYRVLAERATDSVDQVAWADVEVKKDAVVKVALRRPEEHTLEGVVVDLDGHPIERVGVRASSLEDTGRRDIVCSSQGFVGVLTDAQGRFVLRGLTPVQHALTATRDGYAFQPARSSGGVPGEHVLKVAAETQRVRLVVKRNSHIRGRLIGPDGVPLREILINENPVKTLEDGTFTIPNHDTAAEVPYSFEAKKLPTAIRQVKGGQDGPDVDLGDIQMEQGRYISGQVLDAKSGMPVGRILVLVNPDVPFPDEEERAPLAYTASNNEGRFTLGPLESHPFTLRFLDRQPRFRRQNVRVDGTQREVTVRLAPRLTVTATAKDLKGRPVDGHIIHVNVNTEGTHPMTNGTAILKGIDTGSHELTLQPALQGPERTEFAPLKLEIPEDGGDMSVVFQPVGQASR